MGFCDRRVTVKRPLKVNLSTSTGVPIMLKHNPRFVLQCTIKILVHYISNFFNCSMELTGRHMGLFHNVFFLLTCDPWTAIDVGSGYEDVRRKECTFYSEEAPRELKSDLASSLTLHAGL